MVGRVPSVAQALAKVPKTKRKEVEAQKSGKKELRVWSLQERDFVQGFVKNGKLVVSKGKKPGSKRWMLRFVGNVVLENGEKSPFSVILTSGSTSSQSQSQSRSRSRTPRRSSKSPRSKSKSPRRSSKKRGSRSRSRSSSRRR